MYSSIDSEMKTIILLERCPFPTHNLSPRKDGRNFCA